MNSYRAFSATTYAGLVMVFAIVGSQPARTVFNAKPRDATVAQAAAYCADRMAPVGPQYWYRRRAISNIDVDRTVLCFDGRISDDLDLSPFNQLRQQGLLVIRSVGGNERVAIAIADILAQKDITVVLRDFCLSACANAISIATDRTYVLESAIVAWSGGLSGCREPEIKATLVRLQLPCHSIDAVGDFFRKRDVGDRHTILPQSNYTRNRLGAVLRSTPDKDSVSWMWHPRNHRDYFKGRIVFESYPDSQEAVDATIRRFGLHVRVVYDPDE